MNTPLTNQHILLGVTGSIAAYKAVELASRLTQAGAQVDVILTQAALQFITPLTFQSVTGRKAYSDADLWGGQAHILHVGMGRQADLLAIAPCSANTLAKLAHGIADNLLTVTALAAHCPILVAPAMDAGMYGHAATQANVETLRQRGVIFVGPAEGRMASGLVGLGRMVEPGEIGAQIRLICARSGPLAGKKLVVTAGGTQEPIDPVRVVANRSSGKQGFALAQAALDAGANVTLIAGPVSLNTPVGARRINVQTAQEMLNAVLAEVVEGQADSLIMAAAVADFRPSSPAEQKIKKESGAPEITLERTPDILAAVAAQKADSGFPRVAVGFAAESEALLENARKKLVGKKLDLIAANDISATDAGFAVDNNRVTLLDAHGTEALPLMSKDEVAARIIARVVQLIQKSSADPACPDLLVHLCSQAAWQAAQQAGGYRPASLETEHFIHLSRPEQILRVANALYRGTPDLILLWLDPIKLTSALRWEAVEDDTFPHLYGPLNLEAVVGISAFPCDEDGMFHRLPHSAED